MKKLFLALLVGLVLSAPAHASMIQIQITGMNWIYEGVNLYDAGGTNASGNPASSDPLISAIFLVDGAVVGVLTTNVWFDAAITGVGALPLKGTVSGSSGFFGLLTTNANPGWGIALNITNYSITTDTSGANGTMTGSLLDANIADQNLPFGLLLGDPVTVSFSATIFDPTVSAGNYTAFTAGGTGEIVGSAVPIPSSAYLLVAGLIGLITMRRRIRK
jgi:hypothetical protein